MSEVTVEKETTKTKVVRKITAKEKAVWLIIMGVLFAPALAGIGYMGSVFLVWGTTEYNPVVTIFLGVVMVLYFIVSSAGFFLVLITTIEKRMMLKRGSKYTK